MSMNRVQGSMDDDNVIFYIPHILRQVWVSRKSLLLHVTQKINLSAYILQVASQAHIGKKKYK